MSGAASLGVAIFAFTASTPFPGLAALLPCLGTVALLWAGAQQGGSLVNRALALPPAVAIGRISYSLYLFHWPVLALARHYLWREPSTSEALALIGVTFALSALSYRLVEQPFRNGRLLPTRGAAFAAGIAALATMNVFGDLGKERIPAATFIRGADLGVLFW